MAAVQNTSIAEENAEFEGGVWAIELLRRPEAGICDKIDRAFIIPVHAAKRAGAIGLLQRESAIAVDLAEVARLGFTDAPAVETLQYHNLLRQEIDNLLDELRRVVETDEMAWSGREQQRLWDLINLYHEQNAPLLFPFLARGAAMQGSAGRYFAWICGNDLWITHESLGSESAAASPRPVIVYLERMPKAVFLTWSKLR